LGVGRRSKRGLLFVTGVDVHDPIAFVAGPLALLGVVFVASVAPARRAAAIDPARTLRA